MSAADPAQTATSRSAAAGLLLVLAVGAALLALGWGNSAHPLIDFGRELYVPWRLAEGEQLYADLAYFNGPLSPYLNALFFRVFGASLQTLIVCNLAIALGLVVALYQLLRRAGDVYSATLAGVMLVGVFGLSQIDDIGNDTYLTPYSHEITHGLALAALALLCLSRAPRHPVAACFGSGSLLGLVFLTKPEIFLATAAALGVGLIALAFCRRDLGARIVPAFLLGAVLAPLASFALLSLALPSAAAWRGVLGAWPSVFDEALTSQHFYRLTLGTLQWRGNLVRGLAWAAGYLVVLVSLATLALRVPTASARSERGRALAAGLIAFGCAALLPVNWVEFVRPLPLLLALVAGWLLYTWWRALREGAPTELPALRLVLAVFALTLLAKIVLAVHLMQYGFALAMPGALLLVVALTAWLPAWVRERGGSPGVVRGAATGAAVAVVSLLLLVAQATLSARDLAIGSGRDRFDAGPGTRLALATLDEIESRIGPGETLVVLPEGVMLNYLSRRRNPTRHINFMPPELIIFGEQEIIDDFRSEPPDYVVRLQRNVGEYGFEAFGRGYGGELWSWVREHYRPVWRLPAREGGRGAAALLLERGDRSEP